MITALGDSVIKGVLVQLDDSTGLRQYRVSRHTIVDYCAHLLHTDSLNLGRFGCTAPVGELVAERNQDKLRASDIVLIEYGGNDSDYDWKAIADNPQGHFVPRTDLPSFTAAYHRIIGLVRKAGATPVVLSLPPMDEKRYFNFFSRNWCREQVMNVQQWLGKSLQKMRQGHELYNQTTRRIALTHQVQFLDIATPFMLRDDWRDYLCEDGIHPTESGQKRIAEEIVRQLAA